MDKSDIRKDAGEYLRLWHSIKQGTGDDMIALAVFQEFIKDQRLKRIQAARILANEGGLATKRQLDYLKHLGMEVRRVLSKQQASELIEDALADRADQKENEVEEELEKAPARIP